MGEAQQAWASYRDAVTGLSGATLSSGDGQPELDEQTVDDLLTRSEALQTALAAHIESDSADERELAALQLQAAAAVDLEQANQLAAADDGEPPEAALSAERWELIDRVLATPTERGISSLLADGDGNGFVATAADQGTLTDAVNAAIDKIAADAGKAANTTVQGIVGAPSADLLRSLNEGVDKAFKKLGEKVNWLKRKAIGFVLKAIRKLLAVFGSSTEAAQKKITEWIDSLNEEKVSGLLTQLYRAEDLKKAFGERIEKAQGGVPEEREKKAREELDSLQGRWHLRTTVIHTVGGLIPHAKKWIFGLAPPIGGLAYMTAFVLATGYVVFVGGDYLDWREDDGLLDMVDGVGSVVDRAVGQQAPA